MFKYKTFVIFLIVSLQLDVFSQDETCWMLQIASSVYGFLNMVSDTIMFRLLILNFFGKN